MTTTQWLGLRFADVAAVPCVTAKSPHGSQRAGWPLAIHKPQALPDGTKCASITGTSLRDRANDPLASSDHSRDWNAVGGGLLRCAGRYCYGGFHLYSARSGASLHSYQAR